MSRIDEIEIPETGTANIRIDGPDRMTIAGTIAVANPAEELKPVLAKIHAAAMASGLQQLTVDVRELTFVNSSAIRLFVDWASWLKKEPVDRRYHLRFLTNRAITWQKTSFGVLASLAGDVLSLEHA